MNRSRPSCRCRTSGCRSVDDRGQQVLVVLRERREERRPEAEDEQEDEHEQASDGQPVAQEAAAEQLPLRAGRGLGWVQLAFVGSTAESGSSRNRRRRVARARSADAASVEMTTVTRGSSEAVE